MLCCKSFLSKTMRFNLEADCELKLEIATRTFLWFLGHMLHCSTLSWIFHL
jgi:hypothetical protein